MKSLSTLRTPRKQQPLQCQRGVQTHQGESVRQTPPSPLHTVTHTAFRSLDVFVVNKIISTPTLSGTTSVIGVLIKPLMKHSDISIYCLKKTTWQDDIDPYSKLPKLFGRCLCETNNSSLTCCVVSLAKYERLCENFSQI